MKFQFAALGAALVLAACGPEPAPFSNPNEDNGVGFGTPDQFVAGQQAQREKAIAIVQAQEAEAAGVQVAQASEEQAIAAETMTALNIETDAPNAPITALASVEPVAMTDNPEISDEQDFDAVASRQTIESDADRLARNRDQLQVIQPVALPERQGVGGPNIVAYALATNHAVGTPVHRRSGRTSEERMARVCQSYGTDDQAQQAFLANGGPERDRKGVDPDGDGYACDWNPQPFRMARGG